MTPPSFPDPDTTGWPDPQSVAGSDPARALFDAQIEVRKKRVDAEIARSQSDLDSDLSDLEGFHAAARKLAAGSVERGIAGAQTLQKASAAIAALYTAVLGLSFSVSSHPLPLRGVLAPFFLGLAVVLSTAYTAYIGPSQATVAAPAPGDALEARLLERLRTFTALTSAMAERRSRLMRSGVVALGLGLVLLPAPFLGIGGKPSGPTSSTPWPSAVGLPAGKNGETLFQAQVAEAAQHRAQELSGSEASDILPTVIAASVGVVLVVVIPFLGKRG